jgi:hypothetical protein
MPTLGNCADHWGYHEKSKLYQWNTASKSRKMSDLGVGGLKGDKEI